MDFELTDELLTLGAEAREVGLRATADLAVREDSWLIGTSRQFSLELAERGWLGMTWPVDEGGHGRSAIERFVVFEALIGTGAPLATSWFADRQIGPTLLQFGTAEQRRRFLPEIVAGTSAWSIGMSEPDAGSDVASIRTRAVRDGDDWIVNGTKIWTSGAAEADWCYVIARTDPDAPPHAGLSELVVDLHSPGVSISPITDMTGNRHFCEVVYTDVRVPGTNLIGEQNGSFRQVMRQMEHERGGIDRLVSNRALYEEFLPRADARDPLVRQDIAALETGYRIGRHLVLREVLGQAPAGFSAATKTFCTEFEQRVADFCTRVAGPDAMLSSRVARNCCYAPAYTIMGGTTNILRNILGERLLGLPREAALTGRSRPYHPAVPEPTTVALALGSGGARGFAHIGAIQVIEERGFQVVSLAGTSMGALVGGLYAAGKLAEYTDWVVGLTQLDVIRLLDPSMSAPGAIRAEKVLARVRDLLDGAMIEDLPIDYTAVATDLFARKEVWFQKGLVETAIRASIAIPGFITPVMLNGRLLADGGMMDPIPIAPTSAARADVTIAISLSGAGPEAREIDPVVAIAEEQPVDEWSDRFRRSAAHLLDRDLVRSLLSRFGGDDAAAIPELGVTDEPVPVGEAFGKLPDGLSKFDMMNMSLDAMQSLLTRFRLAAYPPDVLVTVPKNACRTLDFHRADEMVALGRTLTAQALDDGDIVSAAPSS